MRQRVVIVGGGVAGLTAAHELAERDFDVHVFERNLHFGGKAASARERQPVEDPAGPRSSIKSDGTRAPGEHGFRFYPGWYRHLPDTMKRIPYKGKRRYFEGATVADNLVSADEELLTWYGREPMRVVAHPPRDLQQARTALSLVGRMRRLGLRPGEVAFFFGKLAEFVTTPETLRAERFDKITWWQFLDADNKSPAFQDLILASTRTMVAAKAREASAYTIANVAVRTLLDGFGTVDRMLNGPTNEVWIDPWIEHLRDRGVHFHLGRELRSIELDPKTKTIKKLKFTSALRQNQQRLQWGLRQVQLWHQIIETRLLDSASWYRRFRELRYTDPLPDQQIVLKQLVDTLRSTAADLERTAAELDAEGRLAGDLIAEVREWPPQIPPDDALEEDRFYTPAEMTKLADIGARMSNAAENLRELAKYLRKGAQALQDAIDQDARSLVSSAAHASLVATCGHHEEEIEDMRIAILSDLRGLSPESTVRANLDRLLAKEEGEEETPGEPNDDVVVTHFVFALPVEQMAYYVNRSPMLTHYDPSLRRLLLLAEHVDWMVGIQFYFKESVDLVRGHLVCMDSEWSLTAVEHTQYWRDVDLPPDIKSIVSVDIAAWDRKGRFNQKEAYNCSQDQIALETWLQLEASVNRDARGKVLRAESLRFGAVVEPETGRRSYHLDDNLVSLLDRRKQGSYEKARSVRFSADELMRRQRATGHESDTPYVWGHRLNFNVEPLLINRVGTAALRPEARTAISNLFLAADYVRTGTDLACMESANEAARHAVNALLDASGSRHKPCDIWAFSPSQSLLDGVLSAARIGEKVDTLASDALKAATGPVGRFAEELLNRGRR